MMTTYTVPNERKYKTLAFLRERGPTGATWFELGGQFGWHHGQSSGVLSTLHKEDRISRLTEKRGKSFVYVDKFHVDGRPVGYQGRLVKDEYTIGFREGYDSGYQDGINAARAMAVVILKNVNDPLTVHNPRCWMNHPACAVRAVIAQINAQESKKKEAA